MIEITVAQYAFLLHVSEELTEETAFRSLGLDRLVEQIRKEIPSTVIDGMKVSIVVDPLNDLIEVDY